MKPGEEAKTTEKDNYTDKNGDKATIPEGFTVSEEDYEIDTGLVVEAPDGSEFVWVPVPKAIATTSPAEPEADTTEKAMAVKLDDGSYRGLLYDFNGTGDDTTSSVIRGCATWNFKEDEYHEPDLVSEYDNDENLSNIQLTQDLFKKEMEDNYKAMIESVEEYGGFYVGRYETSYNGSNVASKTGQTPMTAETDNQMWYGMYDKQKNYAKNVKFEENSEKTLEDIVGSSMIWGSQYDAIMNWMLTSDTERSKVTAASISHAETTTGSTLGDVMNNIYDLGNNFPEWTLQVGGYGRMSRGSYEGGSYPPSRRASDEPYCVDGIGSRLTLYIQLH